MDKPVRSTRFSRIDTVATVVTVVVLGGLVLFLGSVAWPVYQRARFEKNMARCGGNLSTIGKAMAAYANDYNGRLPVAGGKDTRWTGHLHDWSAPDRSKAFALDPNGSNGEATVSSSLYMLVRYMQLDPKSFVCPVDRGTRAFRPEKYGMGKKGPGNLWDFGPDPARHCSYAYQMVYSPYKLTMAAEPAFAIAADRNPWIDGPAGAGRASEFSSFKPDLEAFRGTSEQARLGNAAGHQRDGQNVLFLDTRMSFERRPYCGYQDDNIYTAWDGRGTVRGKPPKVGTQPGDAKDSLLVNDPPAPRK
jgi:hypothetical protein